MSLLNAFVGFFTAKILTAVDLAVKQSRPPCNRFVVNIPKGDVRASAVVTAIQKGDVAGLQSQLSQDPDLAKARIVDERGAARTLLHVAADWPGHFPNGAEVVATLIAAGTDVNAGLLNCSTHAETPLHWAASSDDVSVLDALLDGGADIEAPGAVFTGGPAMSDAVVFAQWRAARRLLERGATTTIWQAAALGLLDRVRHFCDSEPLPPIEQVTNALWHGCRGGQRDVAEYLLDLGAQVNWVGYDHKTPLDVAKESGNDDLVQWLRSRGAKGARETS
jgi:ankyrin repeat protein